MRFAYESVDDLKRVTELSRRGNREQRFRHQHPRRVLRRSLPADELPHRRRLVRDPGHAKSGHDGVAALEGRALRAQLRPAVGHGRRQAQVLRPHADRSLGRRRRAGAVSRCGGEKGRHRSSLRHARGVADLRRRARARRARPAKRQARRVARQIGGAGVRRLRSQSRMAHALSRAGLGACQGARHALQRRRRPQDGARYRRRALRQLVGLPRHRLGPLRTGVRRRQRRRPVPEAQLHLRPDDQCRRQALCRRGLGLSFVHLRQIRRRGAASSPASSRGRYSIPRCRSCCAPSTASSS